MNDNIGLYIYIYVCVWTYPGQLYGLWAIPHRIQKSWTWRSCATRKRETSQRAKRDEGDHTQFLNFIYLFFIKWYCRSVLFPMLLFFVVIYIICVPCFIFFACGVFS